MTHSPQQIRALLAEVGAEPKRSLGQNFVGDPNTVRRIVRLAEVGPGDDVVEIGAGLGSLTLALEEAGAQVVAVEVDETVAEVLGTLVAPTTRVVVADAARLTWAELLDTGRRWKLVANLPYNVGTGLVLDVLSGAPMIDSMLVMVQREVGERLAAPAGTKTYGIPSVKVAWWADAEVVGRVPPTVFVPRPRVESVLVRLVRHERQPDDVTFPAVAHVVEQAFGQRRKMLRRSLAGLVDDAGFEAAGLAPTARPEELDLAGWAALARVAT